MGLDDEYRVYDDVPAGPPSEAEKRYRGGMARKGLILIAAATVLVAAVLMTLVLGNTNIPASDILASFFTLDSSSTAGWIVWRIDMPVIAAAIVAGAGLSLAGTVMQGILKNPLASPYTLGLSNAAAFGAAFAVIFLSSGSAVSGAISIDSPYVTAISAFAFSMVATGGIILLTRITRVSAEAMVLAGIAISAIFSAGLTLMQYLADPVQLSTIISWTFGDLSHADWGWDSFLCVAFLAILLYFYLNRWNLNAIDAGDDVAKGLGLSTDRFRIVALILSALLSALIVSGFGVIAFIGLLGPHIARMIIGSDHRYLIPMAVLCGAAVMLIANAFAMNVMRPMILPVGLLTSLLGGPLFIYLLVRRYKK